MLSKIYHDSTFSAIDAAYPAIMKPWELKHTPLNFWKSEDNVAEALNWLFHKKLSWSASDIENKLSIDVLVQNGLSGMLRWYGGIPYAVLKKMYPNVNWIRLIESKDRFRITDEKL